MDKAMNDTVKLIHSTLEYFKYIGGEREGEKTGEGLDVEIIVLPDLVLDFRAKNIYQKKLKKKKKKKICAVGGRAGRATCTLLHLLGNSDETFQCYLFTKTGNLGSLLLDNEFRETDAERIFRSKFRPLIISRSGEPRCALRQRQANTGSDKIRSTTSDEKSELIKKDFNEHIFLNRLLRRAHTIYLSSVKCPRFNDLFDHIYKKSTPQAKIFIDLSRAENIGLRNFKKLLTKLKEYYEKPKHDYKCGGIFVPINMCEQVLNCLENTSDLMELAKTYHIPIISYGNTGTVNYINRKGEKVHFAKKELKFDEEDIPERFKAGVILASSVFRTLDYIKEHNFRLFNHLYTWWGGNSERKNWNNILQYGTALASAPPKEDINFCTLADLLQEIGDEPFDPDISIDIPQKESSNIFQLKVEMLDAATRLAAARRANNWKKVKGVFRCDSSNKRCGRDKCRHSSSKGSRAVVLFDLDGTLMDSTEQRSRGLRAAMTELLSLIKEEQHKQPPTWEKDLVMYNGEDIVEKVITFFHENVYDNWRIFKVLGIDDFRQKWNHYGWYVTLLVLLQNRELLSQLREWAHHHGVRRMKDEDMKRLKELVADPNRTQWRDDFARQYEYLRSEQSDKVQAAQSAFKSVKMNAFREAWDLLESIDQSEQFELYIVSEGDPDTQWEKLQSTGLSNFFNRERVLTTGDAAEPIIERRELEAAREILSSEVERINKQIEMLQGSSNRFDTLRWKFLKLCRKHNQEKIYDEEYGINKILGEEEDRVVREIVNLDSYKELVETRLETADYVERVIRRMARKGGVSFYSAVIRAILRNPNQPREVLRSFASLMEKPYKPVWSTKFVMIGDRLENDIEPPLRLLSKEDILCIRIIAGKYATSKQNSAPKPAELQPHYIIQTLAQAKVLLLSRKVWNETKCAEDPFVFHCSIVTDGKDSPQVEKDKLPIELKYIICGIEMTDRGFRIIRQVCSGILGECLIGLSSQDDRENLISKCVEFDKDRTNVKERIRRSVLVRATVVNTGAINFFAEDKIVENTKDLWKFFRTMSQSKDRDKEAMYRVPMQEALNAFRTLLDYGGRVAKELKSLIEEFQSQYGTIPELRDIVQ